jgi:hypothetical protein
MKPSQIFLVFLIVLGSSLLTVAQEPKKSTSTPEINATKAQDHNSTRSNKTSNTVAPDDSSGDSNTPKANHNTARSNKNTVAAPGKGESVDKPESSKKGYDYYQSKSDLNSSNPATSITKAQDHNSSRSNKTASSVDTNDKTDSENKSFNQNSSRSNNPQPVK